MAKLTKKEFAQQCGKGTAWLSVYTSPKMGKVIVGDDDLIDTENPINFQFLHKWASRYKPPTLVPENKPDADGEDSDIPTYEQSERRLKHLDAEKREKEVEKLSLDIQKKRGEVIPSELIPPVIMQHNQSIVTAFKNEHEEWLRNFAKQQGMTGVQVAQARGEVVQWINTAMNKATRISINAIEGIVSEYVEKRAVGERL